MFDFTVAETPSFWQCLICTIGFLFVLFLNYNDAVIRIKPVHQSKAKERFFLFCFIFLAVFYMADTDFFHYQRLVVSDLSIDYPQYNTIEIVYAYITQFVSRNYLLFRIIVWGAASLIVFWAIKRYLGSGFYGLYVLFVSYMGVFSYARVSLSMSIFFLGLSFLSINNKKFIYVLCGLILIAVSFEFHHSALLLIALTPIVLVPFNKKLFILILILLPLFSFFLEHAFQFLAVSDLFSEETVKGGVSGGIASYLEAEESQDMSIIMRLRKVYGYLTFIIPFIIISISVFNKKKELEISKGLLQLYKVALGIIIVSLCTIPIFGGGVMFYRTLYMLMIPNSILIVGLFKESILSYKRFRFIISFNMIYMIIDYLYSIYCAIVR